MSKYTPRHRSGTPPEKLNDGPAKTLRRIGTQALKRLLPEKLPTITERIQPLLDVQAVTMQDPESPAGHVARAMVRFSEGRRPVVEQGVVEPESSRPSLVSRLRLVAVTHRPGQAQEDGAVIVPELGKNPFGLGGESDIQAITIRRTTSIEVVESDAERIGGSKEIPFDRFVLEVESRHSKPGAYTGPLWQVVEFTQHGKVGSMSNGSVMNSRARYPLEGGTPIPRHYRPKQEELVALGQLVEQAVSHLTPGLVSTRH